MLEKEYKYYEKIASKLAKEHPDKFAVIKDEGVIGIYDSIEQALRETSKEHKLGTFIVQQCKEKKDIVHRYHSRVSFG